MEWNGEVRYGTVCNKCTTAWFVFGIWWSRLEESLNLECVTACLDFFCMFLFFYIFSSWLHDTLCVPVTTAGVVSLSIGYSNIMDKGGIGPHHM